MVIKTIMFDWGGVCAKGKLGQVLGKQLSPKLKRHHKTITSAYLKYCWDYQIGKLSAKKFWMKVQEELNTNHDHDKLVKHHVTARKLNKGVVELIGKLRQNYNVILVTNTYKEYYEHSNKKYGIDKMFDDIILSYKVKSRKPELRMYKEALKRSKCKANECVFIEDKDKHLVPARKLGMKTILYKNQKDLKNRLKRIGIKW